VRKTIEDALEAEVSDALSRGYYERRQSRARLSQRLSPWAAADGGRAVEYGASSMASPRAQEE
jgi:hypothetical protein